MVLTCRLTLFGHQRCKSVFWSVLEAKRRPERYFFLPKIPRKVFNPLGRSIIYGLDM